MSNIQYDPHVLKQIAQLLKSIKARAKSQRDAVTILLVEKLARLLDEGGYFDGEG